jgi:thiol peroxidase
MAQVTLEGTPFAIKGDIPSSGSAADFSFVKDDLSEARLSDFDAVKVLIAVPSLDTGVCQAETRKFNEQLGKRSGVTGIVVSRDLPFAMKRFCETDGVDNIVTASDFRDGDFVEKYNTKITEGPFKGLSARAVFVVDQNNEIVYSELVQEVGDEPDYDKVMRKVDELL